MPCRVEFGNCLIVANGPKPVRDVVRTVEEAGIECELRGECNRCGEFLSYLRDAWNVARSIELRLPYTLNPVADFTGTEHA